MISFDASVYNIDWKQIQLEASAGDFEYEANAGAAKSQGVELSVETRPLTGMTVSAWVSYDDAVLTEAFPALLTAYGAAGDRLPYTSRLSGSFSSNQDFRISDRVTGFVGGTISYVGDRLGIFSGSAGAPAPRQNLPGYARTDLRTGVRYDGWMCNLFANNIFDKRGLIDGGADLTPANGFIYIQPRTVGINVSRAF
jgi:outer membrane receptor protein involved in Fe transport